MSAPSPHEPGSATGSGSNHMSSQQVSGTQENGGPKKRRHRGGKKRRNRRQSFIAPSESAATEDQEDDRRPSMLNGPRPSAAQTSFYRLKASRSNTSMDSDHLYDHRDHNPVRTRRRSNSNTYTGRPSTATKDRSARSFGQMSSPLMSRTHMTQQAPIDEDDDDEEAIANDRTPLLGSNNKKPSMSRSSTGLDKGAGHVSGFYDSHRRRSSAASPDSRRKQVLQSFHMRGEDEDDYDVNNPPSVPGSPLMGSKDDGSTLDDFALGKSPRGRDAVIDIDRPDTHDRFPSSSPPSPQYNGDRRRRTVQNLAERDVCYPGDAGMSELGEEDYHIDSATHRSPRRRRRRQWPDLEVLDEWTREEKEERDLDNVRAKKITEPVMVGGRLRPSKQPWHREEEDVPYRYTYFNECFDATIHSRTISELCQFGATFKDLFNPEPPELSDESSDEEDNHSSPTKGFDAAGRHSIRGRTSLASFHDRDESKQTSGQGTPTARESQSATPRDKPKRYGPRPTFWLDVFSPTEQEMKILSKAFGIHQLTAEDIMLQEPREKVELFQNYYFVNYRSFEQDKEDEDYMEPVNIYVLVFRDGVISVSQPPTLL